MAVIRTTRGFVRCLSWKMVTEWSRCQGSGAVLGLSWGPTSSTPPVSCLCSPVLRSLAAPLAHAKRHQEAAPKTGRPGAAVGDDLSFQGAVRELAGTTVTAWLRLVLAAPFLSRDAFQLSRLVLTGSSSIERRPRWGSLRVAYLVPIVRSLIPRRPNCCWSTPLTTIANTPLFAAPLPRPDPVRQNPRAALRRLSSSTHPLPRLRSQLDDRTRPDPTRLDQTGPDPGHDRIAAQAQLQVANRCVRPLPVAPSPAISSSRFRPPT